MKAVKKTTVDFYHYHKHLQNGIKKTGVKWFFQKCRNFKSVKNA